jgi:hypothetical protein
MENFSVRSYDKILFYEIDKCSFFALDMNVFLGDGINVSSKNIKNAAILNLIRDNS